MDAFAITVLSRSKKAASIRGSIRVPGRRGGAGGWGIGHTLGPQADASSARDCPLRAGIVPATFDLRSSRSPGRGPDLASTADDLTLRPTPSPNAVVVFGEGVVFAVCWSVKGGSGTTVVASALAIVLAGRSAGGAVLVARAGDAPAALGLPEPGGPGLAGGFAAGRSVPADGLHRLEVA